MLASCPASILNHFSTPWESPSDSDSSSRSECQQCFQRRGAKLSRTSLDSADAGARAGRARSRSQAARRGGYRSTGRRDRAPGNAGRTGTISTGRTSQNQSPEEMRRWTAVCASASERVSGRDQRSPRPSRCNEPSVHQASPSCTIAATAMANRKPSQCAKHYHRSPKWRRAPYRSRPSRGKRPLPSLSITL